MSPLETVNLSLMKATFPEVPTNGLEAATGEVRLLIGQDNPPQLVRNRVDCLGKATNAGQANTSGSALWKSEYRATQERGHGRKPRQASTRRSLRA
jgi:hypothetical protein